MRKKILVKALSKNLEQMSKSSWVRSLKDGKDLVCPFCDQLIQPCKSNPSAMCEQMLRSGTVGKEIEEALKDPNRRKFGVCLMCGKRLTTAHIQKHPTAELCPKCINQCHKMRIKKTVHT